MSAGARKPSGEERKPSGISVESHKSTRLLNPSNAADSDDEPTASLWLSCCALLSKVAKGLCKVIVTVCTIFKAHEKDSSFRLGRRGFPLLVELPSFNPWRRGLQQFTWAAIETAFSAGTEVSIAWFLCGAPFGKGLQNCREDASADQYSFMVLGALFCAFSAIRYQRQKPIMQWKELHYQLTVNEDLKSHNLFSKKIPRECAHDTMKFLHKFLRVLAVVPNITAYALLNRMLILNIDPHGGAPQSLIEVPRGHQTLVIGASLFSCAATFFDELTHMLQQLEHDTQALQAALLKAYSSPRTV